MIALQSLAAQMKYGYSERIVMCGVRKELQSIYKIKMQIEFIETHWPLNVQLRRRKDNASFYIVHSIELMNLHAFFSFQCNRCAHLKWFIHGRKKFALILAT